MTVMIDLLLAMVLVVSLSNVYYSRRGLQSTNESIRRKDETLKAIRAAKEAVDGWGERVAKVETRLAIIEATLGPDRLADGQRRMMETERNNNV